MENGGFLREVQIGSTPCAILTTKGQLENIVNYFCQSNHFPVYKIDAISNFELGDLYVTLTTYKNPSRRNCRTNSEPVFLGPAVIHVVPKITMQVFSNISPAYVT